MELLSPMMRKNSSVLTMSSREIADLVESRHDSVKRTIERLQDKGLIQLTPMVEVKNHLGQVVTEYQLIKRDTYVVVAQLSPEFTARLVDRWQELENQQMPQIPQTLPEALRLAADLADQNQALLLANTQQSTQITSMESYFRNGISPFEFVKGLNGVNSLKVGECLIAKSWLYEAANAKRVAAYARDRYLTEETTEIALHGKEPFLAYKPVLLRKGAAKLYEWYTKGELPMKKNWNGEFTQDKAVGL